MFLKKLLTFFLFLLFTFPFARSIFAEEFKSDYKVEYFLKQGADSIDTDVKFSIKITNLENDIYVSKFTLAFPKSFQISNLSALDDNGNINPTVDQDSDKTKIELEFSNPDTGKGSQNNFFLNFKQSNLFRINGNVWEVILPTITTKENEKYQVVVHLPENTDRKISVAKPRPDLIQGNSIYWNDSKTKTIYAVFGDSQIYKMKLVYNLVNTRVTPVYTDIALPPDLLHQKVFLESLSEKPEKIYTDEDGNYLVRYNLKGRENKKVVFQGYAQLTTNLRPEILEVDNNRIKTQEKYLFSETKYWKVSSPSTFTSLKSASDIHAFLVENFKYDYTRISNNIKRLGADNALKNPSKAVCTEFTDSFIALAREKGIPSREIEGYGFSQDEQLRPQSLVADVLHSWPEYYDQSKQDWISIDPTWENTSGIDYFNSFDLNHIAFAIHGKRSDYPIPAGSYKLENSRDIQIAPASLAPTEIRKIILSDLQANTGINTNQSRIAKFKIKNEGNTFLYKIPLKVDAKGVNINSNEIVIASLAPLEEREVSFAYQPLNNSKAQITITSPYGEPLSSQIKIFPYIPVIIASVIALVIAGGVVAYLRFFRRRPTTS